MMRHSKLIFKLFVFVGWFIQSNYAQSKQNEVVAFENFKVKIFGFKSECNPCLTNAKIADTITIAENPCEDHGYYIARKTLKIISKSKDDRFELSYAFRVDISQIEDEMKTTKEHWDHFTNFNTILPLKKNTFKVSRIKDSKYSKAIKAKYKLKDTLVTGATEGGSFCYRFTKNKNLYEDDWSHLILRIKRLKNKKQQEIKYIAVGLSKGCD